MSSFMTTSDSGLYELYNLTNPHHHEHNNNSFLTFNRHIHLPTLHGHNIIGSSQGFIFSVDPISADLHATSMSPSLQHHHLRFPPTHSLPDIAGVIRRHSDDDDNDDNWKIVEYVIRNVDKKPVPQPEIYYFENRRKGTISRLVKLSHYDEIFTIHDMQLTNYTKAILSPSLDVVVILVNCEPPAANLAFARIVDSDTTSSSSWIGHGLVSPHPYLQRKTKKKT